MSWMFTLKKGQFNTWRREKNPSLPKDENDWLEIFQFGNDFIQDIKNGDYTTKNIFPTINQLKAWKAGSGHWRDIEELEDIADARGKDTGAGWTSTNKEIEATFKSLTDEVLPLLQKRYSKIQRDKSGLDLKPKQTKEGDKTYQWNKPEEVLRYLTDKDYDNLNQKEREKVLQTLNDNIIPKKLSHRPKLVHWANRISKNFKKDINRLFNTGVFNKSSPIIKVSKVSIKSGRRKAVDEKTGELKEIKGQREYQVYPEQILDMLIERFKNYKVVNPFTSKHAVDFYRWVLKYHEGFKPPELKLSVDELQQGDVINLLKPKYDNLTDELLKTFIDNAEKAWSKSNIDLEKDIVETLVDKGVYRFAGKELSLTQEQKTEIEKLDDKQKKSKVYNWLTTTTKGQEKGLSIDFKNAKGRMLTMWSQYITDDEKEFLDSLNVDENYKEIEQDLIRAEEDFNSLEILEALKFFEGKKDYIHERDGKYIFLSPTVSENFKKLKELINESEEDVREDVEQLIPLLVDEEDALTETTSEIKYTMGDFDDLELKFANFIYTALDDGEDLLDVVEEVGNNSVYDIGDVLQVFRILQGQIQGMHNWSALINKFKSSKDMNLQGDKPYLEKEIKEFVAALKEDIPIIRSKLIKIARNHIEEVLEHPTSYLKQEAKKIANKYKGKKITGQRGGVKVYNKSEEALRVIPKIAWEGKPATGTEEAVEGLKHKKWRGEPLYEFRGEVEHDRTRGAKTFNELTHTDSALHALKAKKLIIGDDIDE